MKSTQELKAFLQSIPNFSEVEESAIDWLLEKSTFHQHSKDQLIFKPGDSVDDLIILVEGVLDIYIETPEGRQDLFLYEKGDISGNLPFSRSKGASAIGKVIEDLCLLRLHKDHFVEMVGVSYKLTQALVAVMSDRIRDVSQNQYQDEKLKALGKISAGLAHELNNPASAMVRSAEVLYDKLHETPENFKAVMRLNINEQQTDEVNNLMFEKIRTRKENPKDFTLLERQDRLEELLDWMEDHDVDDAEEIAETFTDFDFEEADLDRVLEIVEEEEKLKAIFRWFDDRLSVEALVSEIREASSRVANLIQSVKKYSHMDQGGGKKATNLHEGLRTTLDILGHRFKANNIEVDKQFTDQGAIILANPGEVNQIWTNIIANAIDAMPTGGRLTIRTFNERDYLCVDIEDNGMGIPEEVVQRIWEPFFTTKGVGEGTGMGLDLVKKIVKRHRGNIDVVSEPGKTVFTVKFLKE